MTSESPAPVNVADAVQQQIRVLVTQRDALMRQVGEIEEKLSAVASLLGIDPASLSAASHPQSLRVDGRRQGSMTEYVMSLLATADEGLTRLQLKTILRDHPEWGEKVKRNENGFYNIVKRGVDRQEIKDVGGRLYLSGKEPPPGSPIPDPYALFTDGGGNA